jgi:hypothetical protein
MKALAVALLVTSTAASAASQRIAVVVVANRAALGRDSSSLLLRTHDRRLYIVPVESIRLRVKLPQAVHCLAAC